MRRGDIVHRAVVSVRISTPSGHAIESLHDLIRVVLYREHEYYAQNLSPSAHHRGDWAARQPRADSARKGPAVLYSADPFLLGQVAV